MSAQDPVEEEVDDDDAEFLINYSYELLERARTGQEKRGALVHWLRGAAIATAHLAEKHPFETSPADLLIAALEGLDGGTTYPVLLPVEVGSEERRMAGEVSRAKARAVAAVQVLLELGVSNVGSAVAMVARTNGMSPGALKSLRLHVLAGKKYEEVRANVASYEAEIRQIAHDLRNEPNGRRQFTVHLIAMLSKDRAYVGRTNNSPTHIA